MSWRKIRPRKKEKPSLPVPEKPPGLNAENYCQDYFDTDVITLCLPGLKIHLRRSFSLDIPHEVSLIVPRAEIRKKEDPVTGASEMEVILNSITVVHSPRHPLAGEPIKGRGKDD